MIKRARVLLIGAALTTIVAAVAPAQEIVNGKATLPERRMQGFVNDGVGRKTLEEVMARVKTTQGDGPSSWVREWSMEGAAQEKAAASIAAAGDNAATFNAYLLAANYYSIAGFPEYYTPAEKQALRKHLAAYEKAGEYMSPPLQVVPVEVRGHKMKTYLHRPARAGRPPLILWTNGTDKFKAQAYSAVSKLVSMGFAVVTFDIAGVAENDVWKLTPDGEFVHRAVLDHYAARKDIDPANIFEVGVSFGGYFAARMAARNDPRLRAVAAVCGPVHSVFTMTVPQTRAALASPERRTILAFSHRIGVATEDLDAYTKAVARFSLVNQKVIIPGRKTIKTPLLVANGGRDSLSTIADMQLLAGAAETQEVWTMGMSQHCAPEYFGELVRDIGEWFLEHADREARAGT
ncbi:MAG: alpha/beta fold hydrolase [Steroidobacter sp.]